MKILIYFFSCLLLSLPHLANAKKSPEEKCFDAQMKVWDLTKVNSYNDKFINSVPYTNDATGKAQYEADAWARCMKR